MNKIIGIDFGKRIGIAIAIEKITVPSFVTQSLDEVAQYITQQKPQLLIVGLPLLLNGTEGEQCAKTKIMLNNLLKKIQPIEYKFQDERFSSKFYKNMKNQDALSAAWILETFINSLRD